MTFALPNVQLDDEISEEAMVKFERLDITDTPRFKDLGSSDVEVPESKKEICPKSGVSRWGGVFRIRLGLALSDSGGEVS